MQRGVSSWPCFDGVLSSEGWFEWSGQKVCSLHSKNCPLRLPVSGGVAYAERLTRDYPNDFRVWRIWGALTLAVTMMQEIAKLKATPHNGVGRVSASCVDDIVDPHTLVINR